MVSKMCAHTALSHKNVYLFEISLYGCLDIRDGQMYLIGVPGL